MKKTIINILAVSAVVLGMGSCVPLDTPPYTLETDLTYWEQNPQAAIAAVNKCYGRIGSMDEQIYADGMTDNAYVKGPEGKTQKIGNGSYNSADSFVYSIWSSRYAGIRDCNQLLANIDRVPNLTPELKARYIAEVKAIRAYHYFELCTKFGDVPFVTNVISIPESQSIERTSKETIYESIKADLQDIIATEALPKSYGTDDSGRITIWAAKAILAKINLVQENWAAVRDLTDDIMSNGGFSLFPSYSGLFELDNESNSEVILEIQHVTVAKETGHMYQFLVPDLNGNQAGYCNIAPTQELVDSYVMLNGKGIKEAGSGYDESHPYEGRDPRLAATVIYTGNSYPLADGTLFVVDCKEGRNAYGSTSDVTPTGYYFKKWYDKKFREGNVSKSSLNCILIRLADIMLLNAEAHVELGTFDAGVWNKTVKLLRERAGFTDSEALAFPSANAKEVVRRERRSELAFEGHHRLDIIRWKTAEVVLNGKAHGFHTDAAVGTENGYVVLENRKFDKEKHYLWPIPQKDRDLNKNLTQNVNW